MNRLNGESDIVIYDEVEDKLNSKIHKLQSQLFITRAYGVIITALAVFVTFCYMQKNNDSIDTVSEVQENYNQIISNQQIEYSTLQKDSEYAYTQLQSMSETITQLLDTSMQLDAYNQTLYNDNLELMNVIDTYQGREELFNKYEYALYDTAGKRTDITYEQLNMIEDLVADTNIPSADLILAIVMTESGGKENAKNASSTAKGFGQLLDTTSKFTYTKLLNNQGWSSSVSLDGTTNLQMTVAYFDYLYEKNSHDLVQAIKGYRGLYDSSYMSKINSYLSNANTSISLLSQTVQE